MEWSQSISFQELCEFFEKLDNSNREGKLKKLQIFLRHCRTIATDGADAPSSLFPIMRLILPEMDKSRTYGMKETALAQVFIDFLQIGSQSRDGMKLKKFRDPKFAQGFAGDFSAVLYSVIQGRTLSTNSTVLSCYELNMALDKISSCQAEEGKSSKKEKVIEVIRELFTKMNDVQLKWFVRIVLKDMKLSVGQGSILNVLHTDAKNIYEVNADLQKVCAVLANPDYGKLDIQVSLMNHFKPQLADRVALGKLESILKGRQFVIENKFDGERQQVHMERGVFKYFSRNGMNFTDDFGAGPSSEKDFTYYLSQSLRKDITSVILDGEMCTWDIKNKILLQKGEHNSIRKVHDTDSFQQCYVIFDICYLNGNILTRKPLEERIQILRSIVSPIQARVMISEQEVVRTKDDVINGMNKAMENQQEGIVLKALDSIYKPNARQGSDWYKMKPDYLSQLMDTCDLLVLGGYYGSGRKGGKITHFILGVLDNSCKEQRFLTCCRVGSGYSEDELSTLLSACGQGVREPPHCVEYGADKPDLWFNPARAPVVQVNAAEIVTSDSYPTGITLRFPRIECTRSDKNPYNCTSLQELKQIMEINKGKLYGKRRLVGFDATKSKSPKKVKTLATNRYTNEIIKTHNLKGKSFVVEPCKDPAEKDLLERILFSHGANISQNFVPDQTNCYIVTESSVRFRHIAQLKVVDLVKKTWVLAIQNNFYDYGPLDTIFAVEKTKLDWKAKFDDFGDSFTVDSSKSHLLSCLDNVRTAGGQSSRSRIDLDDWLDYKFNLMKRKVLFFPNNRNDLSGRLEQILCEYLGGKVATVFDDGVTHVVVEDNMENDVEYLELRKERLLKEKPVFQIVSYEWLRDSMRPVFCFK